MPKRIPISTAKEVAEKHGLRQCLLIGWDGNRVHVVTYGRTKEDYAKAAKAQEFWTGKIREFSFKDDYVTPLKLDKAARAIWNDRVQRNALLGVDLEPWGDGSIPRANGIFEEALAALQAARS